MSLRPFCRIFCYIQIQRTFFFKCSRALLQDYMENVHGKEIPLQYTTVKIPGKRPKGSRSILGNSQQQQPDRAEGDTPKEEPKSGCGDGEAAATDTPAAKRRHKQHGQQRGQDMEGWCCQASFFMPNFS